jgi:hypothetical protein
MYKLTTMLLCLAVFYTGADAQINESFSDGDFSTNPTWTGNGSDFTVNTSLQLQSNNQVVNGAFYLSTPNTLATSVQWEVYARLDFSTSSANYVDIYLTASASNITAASTTGYFVRIGDADDEVSLYRKDVNGSTKIIDGINGIISSSTNNIVKIKAIRNAGNQWILFRDLSGTGSSYVTEGVATDAAYTTSAFFGILLKQSTSNFFQKHFFDDIQVQAYTPDVTPPIIQLVNAITPQSIDVLYNEAVDLASSQAVSNYLVNNTIGNPASAVRDAFNPALVHLAFAGNFQQGSNNTITINGVRDLSGNAVVNASAIFSYYIPRRYDVVIDEIFADPIPAVLLPGAEFLELKNTSGRTINLGGWKVANSTTTSGALPSYLLPADSFIVLTGTTNASSFNGYGRVLAVTSFPALDNTGTTLSLLSKEGVAIHSVTYNTTWYNNAVKSEGGWSLEMIDTRNPCSGAENWKASVDLRGGTPAAKNSVDGVNADNTAPALIRVAAIDSVTVVLTFSEPVDSLRGAIPANYNISDGIGMPALATALAPAFIKVQLTLSKPLTSTKVYNLSVSNIADCSGNTIHASATARLGLASSIDSTGIVINEVLFNPKPNANDYVEIYNRSQKVYDLKDLYIATRSTTNLITSLHQVTAENIPFFPGDYLVLSESGLIVKQAYLAKNPDNFIDVSLPSLADDKGTVVLLNARGEIVDELKYDHGWHFSLIDNEEGISLERVDYNKPTQDKNNWHSAASTVGFGTPSYQNSQFRSDILLPGEVTVTPKVFSPDNDAFDDFAVINFQMQDAGNVANITIYDAAGRSVKSLAKNATLAQTGSFRWDGLDDKLRKVSVGTYIVYTEVFNLSGKKRSFKNAVVVAARF